MNCKMSRILILVLLLYKTSIAQNKNNFKFGNISTKDFATAVYPIDSNASAVVIADIGSCTVEGNTKGWFSIINKHFKRAHILNKNGFDIANVSIYLYTDGEAGEQLDKLKAVTYNLENGKIVETKLETKSAVFEDKIDKRRKLKKFTFPNIKEGSIIEFEYTTVSDFINSPDPWEFQGEYPVLWSEYNFTVPAFFTYTFLNQGYLSFTSKSQNEGTEVYRVVVPGGASANERYEFSSKYTDYKWIIKDVPALKEENFTTTINNHIQKITAELVERRAPLSYYRYVGNWQNVSTQLLDYEYFGKSIRKDNGWLKEVVSSIISKTDTQEEKARNIFYWVRDNFTCTNYRRLYLDQSLKAILKAKTGSVAEINLLLAAMLNVADINTDPVILSTRTNGYTFTLFPMLSQFNYVICRAKAGNQYFNLDASEKQLGFGKLPLRCYNGEARIINENGEELGLESDNLTEVKNTFVMSFIDTAGAISIALQKTAGYAESFDLRNDISAHGIESVENGIKKAMGNDVKIQNFGIDSLKQYELPVFVHYDADLGIDKSSHFYINPYFGENYKTNPFKSAERKYPVEMPYLIDETYTFQMILSDGYIVEEIPKALMLSLNENNDCTFEYKISNTSDNVSLRSRLIFKRTVFAPEEYELLREFFSTVVKKQAEQIIIKKK